MGAPLGIETPRHDLRSVDDVLALVRENGGRVTNSRRLLLEAIFDDPGHHSVEDLAAIVQARAPDVHLSTTTDSRGAGTTRGRGPCTPRTRTRHVPPGRDRPLPFRVRTLRKGGQGTDELFVNLADRAKKEFGFTIDPHHFSIIGRCRNCQ